MTEGFNRRILITVGSGADAGETPSFNVKLDAF